MPQESCDKVTMWLCNLSSTCICLFFGDSTVTFYSLCHLSGMKVVQAFENGTLRKALSFPWAWIRRELFLVKPLGILNTSFVGVMVLILLQWKDIDFSSKESCVNA